MHVETMTTTSDHVWAIGLMSGTSVDGVDAALVKTDGENIVEFGETLALEYDAPFRAELKRLMEQSCALNDSAQQAIEQTLTQLHAQAVLALLKKAGMQASDISVIGFHGQTIWHKPEEGRTCQIGDGPMLARETGINVVNDFRSNDMKHGGQGAPLVPVFHQALMLDEPKPVAVLNIGGVVNVTWIGDGPEDLIAFDTGPGNALINDWVAERAGLPFDEGGKIAASGKVDKTLATLWLSDEYFSVCPPKSLDRNKFDVSGAAGLSTEDGAATLAEFTVRAVAEAGRWFRRQPKTWYVCGGGANNAYVMQRLNHLLRPPVACISELGYDGDMLEAQAFAYLAVRSIKGLPLTFPSTTGASEAVGGGCLHQKAGIAD